ncbi:LCP family protein [Streptacidiphilus monticola]|uniref:LCP family protein n=1 Tax=Streptacidiphilus monticola TaxID=2161674 RepID=A0ABW1GAE9_9ACTN
MTDLSTPPQGGRSAARRGANGSTAEGGARVPAQGGRAAARKAAKKGRKKALRIIAWTTAGVVGVVAAFAGYEYWKLNGNISSGDLHAAGALGLKEKVDPFGRSPINILVMGTDSRAGANCKLGGDCSDKGQRADVEMVVHISADRSNATVMSIPRDLVTELPSCAGGGSGMINSALDKGDGCQVNAVEKLTNIPIDHYVKVSFEGVVSMSNAIGGVPVCVDANVYDPMSHLKLKQGHHVLKGVAALEFVRTRHGFSDGGDVGRTSTQHMFLASMLDQMKSSGTLTNPAKVLDLADAATKALTVDKGLDSITKLISLAGNIDKVPSSRITFATMQTGQDPTDSNRLVIGPGATELFQSIANDAPLTKGKPAAATGAKPSATATTAAVSPASVAVEVENGTSPAVDHRAGAIKDALVAKGFTQATSASGSTADRTSLTYPAGKADQAALVAKALGVPSSAVRQGSGSKLVLLVGNDWRSGVVFPGSGVAPGATANTKAALANTGSQTAADTKGCAHVSTFRTIPTGPRTGITPTQAYARHPEVPNSAP